METEKEIIIYINQKIFGKKNLLINTNLEELRMNLEKEVPNHLSFEKEGKILTQEEEKSYKIESILNNNSIYLSQDYFQVIVDDIIFKKNSDIFKKDSIQKIMKVYQNEFPKNFIIKSKSNLLIQVINYSFDDNLLISDILIDNSIYIFSMGKIRKFSNYFVQNDSLNLIMKRKGNIMFGDINFKEMRILYLLVDGKSIKDKNEFNYEKRKRKSLDEYEIYKNGPPSEIKLENIISNNNTNENAIFDYLILLKKNKNDKFQEKLRKYSYLFDINKLKLLDNKFKEDKFKNYFDEKTNLINFLKNVINGYYNDYYNNIDLILREIDYRDDIQKDIISPFLNGFDEGIYINIPISISDNNLFFHYLRVKFFECLQNSFDSSQKQFVKYCRSLLKKIEDMTCEKEPKLKKTLLLEILCMICVYGFHDNQKTGILDYYNCIQNEKNEKYYHPIIFFCRVKNILFDYFRMIGNSNCMKTALIEYQQKINNNYTQKRAKLDINNLIENLLRNTVFLPFFSKKNWGFTIPAFNLSFINIDIFDLQENKNSYPDYIFLFYFIKYIISFLHESLEHNFQISESYNEMLETPFDTPRLKEFEKEIKNEGGYLMEILLINSVNNLNIEHILFLLNENNWKLEHKEFLIKFKEIKTPVLENCMEHIKKGKLLLKFLNLFQINQKSIENAINNNIHLSTNISQNEKKGRVCRTHLFYK